MGIILKTIVVNKLKNKRTITWANGNRRIAIEGGGQIILEGAYPNESQGRNKKALLKEVELGWTELKILTNLAVEKATETLAKPKKVSIKPNAAASDYIAKATKETPKENARFVKGGLDEVGKPPEVVLPGSPDMPKLPEKVEIFKDGGQPIGEESVKEVEIIPAAPAPKGTTKADTEAAASIDEKKETVKKPRSRRTSKKSERSDKE